MMKVMNENGTVNYTKTINGGWRNIMWLSLCSTASKNTERITSELHQLHEVIREAMVELNNEELTDAKFVEAIENSNNVFGRYGVDAETCKSEEIVLHEEEVVEATSVEEQEDIIYVFEALTDGRDVVVGVLEGAYEPGEAIRKSYDFYHIKNRLHGEFYKNLLESFAEGLQEFYYGETSGEDLYRAMTRVLVMLLPPTPHNDGPKHSGHDVTTDNTDVVSKEGDVITRALVASYDTIVGVVDGTFDKSVVRFAEDRLLELAGITGSEELRIVVGYMREFYFDSQRCRNILDEIETLRRRQQESVR